MRVAFLLILFGVVFSMGARAQVIPNETDAERRQREQVERVYDEQEKISQAVRDMAAQTAPGGVALDPLRSLRIEWEKRLKEIRAVDPGDVEKFRSFLGGNKTGIFRLLPNFDCVSKVLIKTDGDCAGFVPDMSDFSFRRRDYADHESHDIGYLSDKFVTNSFFAQGILVSLGNESIEDASLSDAGMKFLVDLKPDTMASAARETVRRFKHGVDSGGFTYSDQVKVAENTTYALRFIGYKSDSPVPEGSTLFEARLSHLNFDQRIDSLVVFRVIRLDPGGALTIVWKELSRKKTTTLHFAKGERPYDFKL